MAIKLSKYSAGIDQGFSGINEQTNRTTAAPTKSGTSFFPNLGKSLASIPMAAVKWAGNEFANTIGTAGKGIAQAIPGIGTIAQFNKGQEHVRTQLQYQLKSAHDAYNSRDPKIKISEAEYKRRIGEVNKSYERMAKEGKDFDKTLISAGDTAKALAETMAMPFAFGKLAFKGAGAVEKVLTKVPSLKAAAETQAAKVAAGTLKTRGPIKTIAIGAVKYPLIIKPTVDTGASAVSDAHQGKWLEAGGNAALLASGALKGGPIGAIQSLGGKIGKATTKAVYGQDSLFAQLAFKDGKTMLNHFNELEFKIANGKLRGQALTNAKKEVEDLKIWHQYKMDESNGDVKAALADLTKHANTPFAETTVKGYSKDVRAFKKGQNTLDTMVTDGKLATADGASITVPDNKLLRIGRFSAESKLDLYAKLKDIDDSGLRFQEAVKLSENAQWGQNENLKRGILEAVKSPTWRKDLAKLTSTLPADVKVKGLPKGYFPTFVSKGKIRANFKSIDEVTAKVGPTVGSKVPVLQKLLEDFGVSTKTADQAVYPKIEQTAKDNINKLGIKSLSTGKDNKIFNVESSGTSVGEEAINRLAQVAQDTKGVYDLRQLKPREIAAALGVDDKMAIRIRGAIDDAHFAATMGERGLANRVQDINIKYNKLARGYSRIQGTWKYERNWFFRGQETIETMMLSQGLSGGSPKALRAVFGRDFNPQPGIEAMKDSGLLRTTTFGGGGMPGSPFVSAKLTDVQMRTLSGMLTDMAQKSTRAKGDIKVLLEDDVVRDMVRSIVQYPSKGFFGSNAARTLNTIAFPVSYNFKVAKLTVDILAKQPAMVQIAAIKGVTSFDTFLKSDDGIKWQSDNSEAIGIFNYFTPLNSIRSVANILGRNGNTQISDFGMLGGLPFGFITQILEANGVIATDNPYLDPKTGQQVPKKIPADLSAEAYTVLKTMIGTMFNYPGRQLGIDASKTDLIDMIPGASWLKEKGTFNVAEPRAVSASQAKQQRVLGGAPVSKTMNKIDFSKAINPGEVLAKNKPYLTPEPPKGKAKKPAKAPAWLKGYKTTTASKMPGA